MKLGCMTLMFANSGRSLEDTLAYLSKLGFHSVELATGGYLGNKHANPEELLSDPAKLQKLKDLLKRFDIEISDLACHSNQLHPNPDKAATYQRDLENTIRLAEKLGVRCVATFSGCPGDSPGGKFPNWVIQPFPDDFPKVLEYQWNEVAIPYWTKMSEFALNHGVDRIGIEMYPGFLVYNPDTLFKLRNAVGKTIGSCFDPAHIMWQGVHAPTAIQALGDAIFHVHAKDCKVNENVVRLNGLLDSKPYNDAARRAWYYRIVGYGHDTQMWKDIVSSLSMIGYTGTISIERDDCVMSPIEGFEKATAFLKDVMIFDDSNRLWRDH